jgi:hypothetical protein
MMPTMEIPLEWFGQYPVTAGKRFRLDVEARVVKIEVQQLDTSSLEVSSSVDGQATVTLALSDPRVHLIELEKWPGEEETHSKKNPRQTYETDAEGNR